MKNQKTKREKLSIKAPVIFKETECDEDITDDDAIMKAGKEQEKNLNSIVRRRQLSWQCKRCLLSIKMEKK